ncbi:MAG TPA: PKD domain-containing protein [Kofleriaceae bacterium]|jgi:PKD repeat protein
MQLRWLSVLVVVGACGGEVSTSEVEQSVSTTGAVLTQHGNSARTGLDANEPKLTQDAVQHDFGLLWSQPAITGRVFAQPLYAPGVNGHDVVYVATEANNVYALDATTGAQIWTANFGPTVPSTDLYPAGCMSIPDQVGITGTPVIDPVHNTIYFVNATKVGVAYHQYLNALDLQTGAPKANSPKEITASVPGDGELAPTGLIAFDPKRENQRAGLLFDPASQRVFIAWGSHCTDAIECTHLYEGWVMAYDATSLTNVAAWISEPHAINNASDPYGGGIWMSGGGLAFDGTHIFVSTGNGNFSAPDENYGDSVLAFDTNLARVDSFTPFDQSTLVQLDLDVSSIGPVVVPDSLPAHPSLLLSGDKDGTVELLDRASLGGAQTEAHNDTICPAGQSLPGCIVAEHLGVLGGNDYTERAYGQPAYFAGNLYIAGRGDHLKKLPVISSTPLQSVPAPTQTTTVFNYPGATPSITSNGTNEGVVWAIERQNELPGGVSDTTHLHAYRASDLSELWATSTIDDPDQTAQFVAPMTAAGQVFVPGQASLNAYGVYLTATPVNPAVRAGGNVMIKLQTSYRAPGVTYALSAAVTPVGSPMPTLGFVPSTMASNATANVTFQVPLLTPVGPYTVTFTATAAGRTVTASTTITVEHSDGPPTAAFTANCYQQQCTFDASASSDVEGPIVSYTWGLGDFTNASGVSPSHTYAGLGGTYTVRLTVKDSAGQLGMTSQTVVARDQPPIPSFTTTCNARVCALDAETSYDDGGVTGWRWHWGDGNSTAFLTTNEAQYTYAAAGTYTITLDVSDAAGQIRSVAHTINAMIGPTAAYTVSCTGRTCSVNASGSTGGIATYHWDWGDESVTDATVPTASHTFAYGATFDVELIVTDSNGQQGSIHQPVTVP